MDRDPLQPLREAVAAATLAHAEALDNACVESIALGCGVSVVGPHPARVMADPRVPCGAIWIAPTSDAIDTARLRWLSRQG